MKLSVEGLHIEDGIVWVLKRELLERFNYLETDMVAQLAFPLGDYQTTLAVGHGLNGNSTTTGFLKEASNLVVGDISFCLSAQDLSNFLERYGMAGSCLPIGEGFSMINPESFEIDVTLNAKVINDKAD